MFDFLTSYDLILSIQKWSNPFLDFLFLALTQLGDGKFFLLALAYLFWCRDQKLAVRLASLFLFSALLVYFLKVSLSFARPDASLIHTHHLRVEPTESFPSGHAAGVTVFWGYLAFTLRKKWMTVLSLLLIVLVSFSRIYLGVHFLRDVLGGIALGLLVLGVAFPAIRFWQKEACHLPEWFPWAISWALPSLIVMLSPDKRIARCAGLLLGIWVGTLVERKWIFFDPRDSSSGFSFSLLFSQIRSTVLGLIGAGILYGLLKWIPWPGVRLPSYVIHGFMGFYMVAFFPLILKKFRMKA